MTSTITKRALSLRLFIGVPILSFSLGPLHRHSVTWRFIIKSQYFTFILSLNEIYLMADLYMLDEHPQLGFAYLAVLRLSMHN